MSMGKFSAFKVPLKSLSKGLHTFTFHLDKDFFVNMESTDIHDADVNVTLSVNVLDELYSLEFQFEGTVTLLCDRCLDDLIFPIDTSYRIDVKYGDDYCDESDTLLEIPWGDHDLNVAYMIYDTVSLEIPIKHVHPMGKCNKVMSALLHKHNAVKADEIEQDLLDSIDDGDNAPVDPRWDVLKALATEGENNDNDESND